ncbi:7802_t:CDS:1, partial [Gigaspora margarita]
SMRSSSIQGFELSHKTNIGVYTTFEVVLRSILRADQMLTLLECL